MSAQLVSVGFGKQSFSASSASFSAFVVTPEFKKELPSKAIGRQGNVQSFPASAYPEVNGSMYVDSIPGVVDGTILLLQASQKQRATPIRDGAIFIHARTTGPMLAIRARMVAARESRLDSEFLVFQGRGDILTGDDLATYGIVPYANYLRTYMDADEIAECYTIEVMGAESAPRPSIETATTRDGEVVALTPRPGRRRTLRRTV